MPQKTKSANQVEKQKTTSKSPLAKKRAINEISKSNASDKLDQKTESASSYKKKGTAAKNVGKKSTQAPKTKGSNPRKNKSVDLESEGEDSDVLVPMKISDVDKENDSSQNISIVEAADKLKREVIQK